MHSRSLRLALCLGIPIAWTACSPSRDAAVFHVVQRGDVTQKAVATGVVEPERETQVNTQLAGFVRKVHVRLGQKIEAGAPLAEVWPTLTEQDLLRAERAVASAKEGEEEAMEFVNGEHTMAYLSRLMQGGRSLDRMKRAAERGRRSAEELLELLRTGAVEIDGRRIDFVVRAPVAGHVLQIVREGDPVTPASNFGIGTVVAVLGDLERPVFRGSVDEIDVGRMSEGLAARVRVGPLPDSMLEGKIVEIGLRARRVDNAVNFDVRIALEPVAGILLRAGYSAVAEIEFARAVDTVVLPERLITWRDGKPSVQVAIDGDRLETRALTLGVADGMTTEVRVGLREGDRVAEPSVR
ncbi:MAG: efflux RND transporter periplasmic adaptor subunit [Planctomycetota bacterium]